MKSNEKEKMTKALAECTSEMGLHGCDLAFVMAAAVAKKDISPLLCENSAKFQHWQWQELVYKHKYRQSASQSVSQLVSRKVN